MVKLSSSRNKDLQGVWKLKRRPVTHNFIVVVVGIIDGNKSLRRQKRSAFNHSGTFGFFMTTGVRVRISKVKVLRLDPEFVVIKICEGSIKSTCDSQLLVVEILRFHGP